MLTLREELRRPVLVEGRQLLGKVDHGVRCRHRSSWSWVGCAGTGCQHSRTDVATTHQVRGSARSPTSSPCGCGSCRRVEDDASPVSWPRGRLAGMNEHIEVDSGDVLLAAGTMKGAWLFAGDPGRGKWRASGPHFRGEQVYAIRFDGRGGRRRLLAGTEHGHWGAVVRSSDDLGRSWSEPAEGNLRFPEGTDAALARVWQLQPASDDRPGTVWAGVEPAALFRSDDGGETFELVKGL